MVRNSISAIEHLKTSWVMMQNWEQCKDVIVDSVGTHLQIINKFVVLI